MGIFYDIFKNPYRPKASAQAQSAETTQAHVTSTTEAPRPVKRDPAVVGHWLEVGTTVAPEKYREIARIIWTRSFDACQVKHHVENRLVELEGKLFKLAQDLKAGDMRINQSMSLNDIGRFICEHLDPSMRMTSDVQQTIMKGNINVEPAISFHVESDTFGPLCIHAGEIGSWERREHPTWMVWTSQMEPSEAQMDRIIRTGEPFKASITAKMRGPAYKARVWATDNRAQLDALDWLVHETADLLGDHGSEFRTADRDLEVLSIYYTVEAKAPVKVVKTFGHHGVTQIYVGLPIQMVYGEASCPAMVTVLLEYDANGNRLDTLMKCNIKIGHYTEGLTAEPRNTPGGYEIKDTKKSRSHILLSLG